MTDFVRLIETEGFPLDAASEASATESSANRGSIRTLHRYPARRPLAACRAAILATLLPDPGNREDRLKMRDLIGSLLQKDTGETKELLRARELLQDGRDKPWRVLDPFAGGGSIPFEALRLGCDVESSDLNPVAWFVQMATMYYPSKIGLDELPLPDILKDDPDCFAAAGGTTEDTVQTTLDDLNSNTRKDTFNLAEHVAAWGTWLAKQCDEILRPKYHASEGATPLAYIWCRTYTCPSCRGCVPILNNSILQTNKNGVVAAVEPIIDKDDKTIEWNVLCRNSGDDTSKHNKISFKTRNKVACPFCDHISITSKEIRRDAQDNNLGHELIAVVESHEGKRKYGTRKYRTPVQDEGNVINKMITLHEDLCVEGNKPVFDEPVPEAGKGASRAFSVGLYGMTRWKDLFNPRQYWSNNIILNQVREVTRSLREHKYPKDWVEGITVYINCVSNLVVERNTVECRWYTQAGKIQPTYETYALPIRWLYVEQYPASSRSGSIQVATKTVSGVIGSLIESLQFTDPPKIIRRSALEPLQQQYDLIITDPPYYDQIPYSDTLDFFYMQIQTICRTLSPDFTNVLKENLTPKWDEGSTERELIDDSNRHGGDRSKSKKAYEDGMADVFRVMNSALKDDGRLVVVFAHKDPVAWETLVTALIRAGFTASAAWPIRTEKATKLHSGIRAFLSTSVWLVLKKRDPMADYAFDRDVFPSIKENIEDKLRRFWDAGVRGPDFLWAALGPGLEIYSQYDVVRKFDSSDGDELVTVGEFLDKVRDIVLRFSIGRLLTDYGSSEDEAELIDDLTRYYLLHRSWYGHDDVDAGEVTKFAVACGFTDTQLSGKADILCSVRGKKRRLAVAAESAAADKQADADKRGGSKYSLNRWNEREPPKDKATFNRDDRQPALIDHVHRLLHLRMEGDKQAMDNHIKHWALGGHSVMPALVQALQEIAKEENAKSAEELSLLESLSKDLERLAGAKPVKQITLMDYMNEEDD